MPFIAALLGQVALSLLFCVTADAQTPPPRTVLAIYFSSEDYPANAVHDAGIREGLRSLPGRPIEYYAEYLESDRFPSEQATLALRDYLREKYRGRQIDAVVAVSDTVLRFVLRFRQELFANTPVVHFGNVAVGDELRADGAGITGVVVGNTFVEGLQLALRLHPATEQLVLIAQAPDTAMHDAMRAAFEKAGGKTRLTFINRDSAAAMLADVRAVPPRSLVFFVRHPQDTAGRTLFAADIARMVAEASPVPVYGVTEAYMGSGVVGGSLYVTHSTGMRLGQQVLQILDGTPARDIPIENAVAVPTFDARQLRRWGIAESLLPAGSVVRFQELTGWDQYRPEILAAIALTLLQAGLIGALLVHRSRRRRVEGALLETQRRYALASAAGAVGIWDWNFETNELFIDERLKSLLGFGDAEISRRPDDWGSRVYPQDLPVASAAVQACVDGSDTYEVEHRMIHKSGEVRWMLSRGSAIRSADGKLRRLVGTKVDITDRKRAEDVIRENQAVLQASNDEIQNLAGRLIASQEVERARIARDLHDDLSQQIAGLSIALSALKRQINLLPEPGTLPGDVASLQQRAIGLAENLRNLSHDLHPTVLEHAGLVAALQAYCADIERQHAIRVTVDAEGELAVSSDVTLCLYRIAQEAMRNVITHARARHAEVRLLRIGDHLTLTVADDGAGFDIIKSGRNSRGLGLVSINERARLCGGTVSIVTELGKGTRVRVQIPAPAPVLASPQP